MNNVKMPDKDALYNLIEQILSKENDVEIRLKANGEVGVYELHRKKREYKHLNNWV